LAVLSLGHLLGSRRGSGGRCRGLGLDSPVERLRLEGRGRVAVVDLAGVLAQGEAVDARNGARQAVGVLTLEEVRGHGQVVAVADGLAGGAGNETAQADAGVEIKLEAVVDLVAAMDALGDAAVEHAGKAVADDRCSKILSHEAGT